MRRIWAHIIIAITTVIMMVVTFAAVANNLNVGLDYASGKTLTFHVTEKTDNGENNPEAFGDDSLKEIVDIMEARLKATDANDFDVAEFGKDLIKVTLYQDSVDYSQIKEYLSFDGSLYLYSYDSDKVDHYVSSEAFINAENPANLKGTQTVYPTINIPVDINNEAYKTVVFGAVDSDPIEVQPESEEGAGDAQTARFMYLVYGFVPGRDTFTDENFSSKVLLKFEIKGDDKDELAKMFDYYVEDDTYSLSTIINVGQGEDGAVDPKNIATAWENGTFYVNLLNAGSYDFDVTCINEEVAPAKIESIYFLNKNQTVFESSTFIAFACAIILVSLILIVFYKLGALSISVTSLTSVFMGILFLMIFGSEFNLFAVVGLILVGFASLASGCVYANKLKDEAYRGRSLKKANTEASKKSTLVVTDIHFVLILLGAFTYLIGTSVMKSFALVTVLAGLVSLILNLTAFKGFMWLDTNASFTQGKYNLFGIDPAKVPNLANEEKQTYFGPYADRDMTKKSKLITIISGAAFGLTLISMLVWGIVNKSVYNNPTKSYQNEIFFKIDNEKNIDLTIISGKINSVLDDVKLSDGADAKKLSDVCDSPVLVDFDVLEYDSDQDTPYYMHCYAGYVVKVNEKLPENVYYGGTAYKASELFSYNEVNNVVADEISEYCVNVELASGEAKTNTNLGVGRVFIAVGAALLTSALYLLARYKLSRGLASLITTLVGTTVTAGLLSLLYFIAASNTAVIGAVIGEFVCLLFAIIMMDREKELILDDKKHDNSYENRNEIMKKAIAYGFGDILNIGIVGLYLGINFFGFGPAAMAWVSVEIIVGVAIAFILAMFVLGPVSQFFYKKFINVGKVKPRKTKSKNVVQNKSAEPEEAIFIGIND